jgi:predicted nucleotidyltransferase
MCSLVFVACLFTGARVFVARRKDYFGVYVANENGPVFPPTASFNYSGTDPNRPDHAIYEISMFVNLLKVGNPKVIEPLFTGARLLLGCIEMIVDACCF